MAKPKPVPPVPAASSAWLPFWLSGLCGLLLGATGMYFLLLPKLPHNTPLPPPSQMAPDDPGSHLPPPELTAGQAPAEAERTLGNFYYDHQNWPEAIRHYEAALKQGPDSPDIRTDLGNAYRFSHRPEDALAQYAAAQRLNPAHEFSLFNQGGLYLEDLKQPAKAIAIWQEYLVRFPQGSNVAAARQLIAQAGGGSDLSPVPAPSSAPDAIEEARLLQLIAPAKK